jgi:hypothetical protein
MPFPLFRYLDSALIKQETRESKASNVPAVWPSEASAEKINKSENPIAGTCHRQSYLRMIAWPVSNNIDAIGAWKWVTGRMMENNIVDLAVASDPSIFVASGVRSYVPDIYMPFELDLVVIDPETKRGWICECKTYTDTNYVAKREIETLGQPKINNLMQNSLYLLEIPTGKKMKEVILKGLEDRKMLDSTGTQHRNRIEANLKNLEQMDDGPLGAKLVYVGRGNCGRTEFDISIEKDFDGSSYPVVNSQVYKMFPLESMYSRFRTLQEYWFRARREAVEVLKSSGIEKPPSLNLILAHGDTSDRYEARNLTEPQQKAEKEYLDRLENTVLALPDSFWPPAEYEFSYSQSKIERLRAAESPLVPKTKYQNLQKKKIARIGDWQCSYCKYRNVCIPKQNPSLSYMLYDINKEEEAE